MLHIYIIAIHQVDVDAETKMHTQNILGKFSY